MFHQPFAEEAIQNGLCPVVQHHLGGGSVLFVPFANLSIFVVVVFRLVNGPLHGLRNAEFVPEIIADISEKDALREFGFQTFGFRDILFGPVLVGDCKGTDIAFIVS